MRIQRLSIRGFGNLRGEFIFASDRCNLLLEPNEAGKSTLASAILTGLYGFPRQRSTARQMKDRDRHRPWAGDEYGLELEIECGGRALSIQRDFARDTVVVRDGRTGKDVTPEFSTGKDAVEVGEILTGLGRDEMTRCCFISQREIDDIRDSSGLTAALQRAASSRQGDVAAAEAMAVLDRALQKYKGTMLAEGKIENEIRRLQQEMERLDAEAAGIGSRRLQCEDRLLQLEDATRRGGLAEADLSRVEDLEVLAAAAESRRALEQAQREMKTLEEYRQEESVLQRFASFPPGLPGRMREIKGKLAQLTQRRTLAIGRLEDLDQALARAEADLRGLAPATADEAARAAARLAVLEAAWAERRERRRARRREARRLSGEGLYPDRRAGLAARMAELTDEDRRFLEEHRERLLESRAALAEAERRKERLALAEEGERFIVPLAAHRGKERLALATLAIGIVLSAVLPFTLANKVPVLFTVLAAFGGLLWWLMLLEKRPVPGAEEFGTELQRLQTEVWGHEKELAGLHDRVSRIALALRYDSSDSLIDEFRELELLERAALPLATLEAADKDARERYARAAEEMAPLMTRAGTAPPARVTPSMARRFVAALSASAGSHAAASRLREERDAARDEVARIGLDIEMQREEMTRAASEAFGETDPFEDPDALMTRFEEAGAGRARLDRLRAEIIPALAREDADSGPQRVDRLRRELEILARHADEVNARHPGEPELTPVRTSREYADERARLQEEARRMEMQRRVLSEELADVLREYRRELPVLLAQRSECETALRRATAFRDAVGIAAEVLSRQSRESYTEWASALNQKVGHLMRALSGHYADVRFDTDLSFTVRDVRTGRTLDPKEVDGHLSAGARDQISLAVRLGLSEYLSGAGISLPLILDDPFAAFDDNRFDRAMELLVNEVGRRHQLIVLSCHASRHRRWLDAAPPSLSTLVRVVDLTPLLA